MHKPSRGLIPPPEAAELPESLENHLENVSINPSKVVIANKEEVL